MGKALKTFLVLTLFAASAHAQGILPQVMQNPSQWKVNQHVTGFCNESSPAAPGTKTCTASGLSAVPAGHLLIVPISGWLTTVTGPQPGKPTMNSPTSVGGSETWVRCPAGAQSYWYWISAAYNWTDCWYVLSASGGETSVTSSITTSLYTTGEADQDIDVFDVSVAGGKVSLDASNGTGTSAGCGGTTTCSTPSVTVTSADFILTWISNPDSTMSSIGGSYTLYDVENVHVEGAFAGASGLMSGASVSWTFAGNSTNCALSTLAFKSQ